MQDRRLARHEHMFASREAKWKRDYGVVVVVLVVAGTVVVVVVSLVVVSAGGPSETLSRTVVPLRALPLDGLCATTVSTGWSDATRLTVDLKPWASRSDCASSTVVPTTLGTSTSPLPLETFRRTFVPGATFSPAAGSCATTTPEG